MKSQPGDMSREALEKSAREYAHGAKLGVEFLNNWSVVPGYPDIESRGETLGTTDGICPCHGAIAHDDSPPSDDSPCAFLWKSLRSELAKVNMSLVWDDNTWYGMESRPLKAEREYEGPLSDC